MSLPIQSLDTIVNNQAAAMQANSVPVLDFSIGSVLLALIESNAANSIWLQALATTLLSVTRLSTSSGSDVDTFIADFGFSRNAGSPSSGSVTFSRFTTTVQGVVPVGTRVSVPELNLIFTVTLDAENGNYDPVTNSYIVPISTSSMIVPVLCGVNGTIGNVIIGAINTIINAATTPGIDTVTNEAAFTNGIDPWNDTTTKSEFLLYIQSLSRATLQAIQYAVSTATYSGHQVTRYNIVENENEAGDQQLGYFYVVIDDGSGMTAPDGLIDAVSENVSLYRGLTIQYNVDATLFTAIAIVVWVNLVSQPTETVSVITNNIKSSLQVYSASIPFNQPFLYSKISEIVYESDVNILSIPSSNAPTLNAGNSDVAGDNLHVFGIPTITVHIL